MTYNLLLSLPDPRDYLYWPRKKIEDCPRSLDKRSLVTRVEDQGNAGTCGGNGFTSQNEGLAMQHGVPLHLSRMFSYTTAKKLGNRMSQDGVFMRDLYRAGYHFGLPPEEGPNSYPYDIAAQYTDPPAWAYAEAAKMKVERYEAIVSTANTMLGQFNAQQIIDRLILALNEGFLPTIGVSVTASLSQLTGPWRQHQYKLPGPNYPAIGGHLMTVVGYDMDFRMFLVLNSYGLHRGDGGYVGLPFDICSDWMFESWITRSFNNWSHLEQPGIVLAGINRLNIAARIIPEPHEVGQTVNVWFGAKRPPSGAVHLRDEAGNWRVLDGDSYPPTLTGVQLADNNYFSVVGGMNLDPYAGLDVYVAYGQTPMDWKLQRLCTIPSFN